ncbi:MAG TPA: SCO family protein, partial [Sphingobacteriaceae bacterium]|nr:SCO family protein [Sphingobacteriaceae bacterium]
DFKLINQKGDSISFTADSNKITVMNFFFTRCPSFCKSMNKEMSRVAETYQNNNFLRFLSISVDPDFDTAPVLLNYSKSYNASGKWNFLTGSKDLIYKLSRQDFLVDALKDTSVANNFIHSPMLILVDPHKHIRGYYDSGSKDQVDRLIDEIKVLIAEELRNVKDR